MEQKTELLSRLKNSYKSLSKGQKKLADYILEHSEQAAFMTAAQLGGATGVSESTAVRFAAMMVDGGYPVFQKELAQVLQQRLDTVGRMEARYGEMNQPKLLKTVLEDDMGRIEKTLTQIDGQAFEQAVQMIDDARKIYIVGLRNSAPLAAYLSSSLNMIYEDIVLLSSNSEHELLEQMIRINSRDTVIGISFPRYSMRTLKLLEFANSRQAGVISLTDSIHSPLNLYSSCNLTACSDMSSVASSMAAPMSVINALITALCMKHKKQVVEHLKTVERTLLDYQVEGTDEMDYVENTVELKPFYLMEHREA